MTIKYIKEEAAWLADFYHSAGSNILLKVKTRLNKSNMCVAIVKLRDSDGNVNVEKYYSFSTLSNVKNEMLDYFITNIKNGIDVVYYSKGGKYFGRLSSTGHVNVERQRLQCKLYKSDFALGLSVVPATPAASSVSHCRRTA